MSSALRQLTSWKEIAHHLGVNVRTAQKWERERGLPVRRAPGVRSRVSTDLPSLEAWKQQLACATKREDQCFRWPLGYGIAVEIRFVGNGLRPGHIDLLREFLELVKTALSNGTPS